MFSSINYKYRVDEAVQLMLLAVMFFLCYWQCCLYFHVIGSDFFILMCVGSDVFILMILAVISLF